MDPNAFERRKIIRGSIKSLPLECKEIENFLRELCLKSQAHNAYLVGGAIRQLVRTICWKGETPEDILLFLDQNLRDRDILVDRDVDPALVDSLWSKHLAGVRCPAELDILVHSTKEYVEQLDWHSNAVWYDGRYLCFLPLKEGEDYLCSLNQAYNRGDDYQDGYMLLRGWINHHPIRGFDCFADTFPAQSMDSFYFPTYLKKLVELNRLYGKDDIFFAELKTLYKSGWISRETYLSHKVGTGTLRFLLLNNKEAITIVAFYLLLFYFILSSSF